MRIGWVGFHVEGLAALRGVLETGFRVEAVVTLKPHLAAKRSGAGDYAALCREFGVPLYEVANINDEEALTLLRGLRLDVVFVIGWTQIVRREALSLARVGMIGAHASLLPHNRGRAPVNWAIIRGEARAGNTLMWLAEGVDTGDIIDQTSIEITPYDTCATVYEKVSEANAAMILRLLPLLLAGGRPGRPQPATEEPNLPGRRPEDGLIDWGRSSREVYDFIRALTRPYPGAFTRLDGRPWHVWQAALVPASDSSARPGEIVGPVFSPAEEACGQMVACGRGTVILLEIEGEGGEVLRGRRLSEQNWEGKRLSNE
jgi:methionyl-tRNA formyltransferase